MKDSEKALKIVVVVEQQLRGFFSVES